MRLDCLTGGRRGCERNEALGANSAGRRSLSVSAVAGLMSRHVVPVEIGRIGMVGMARCGTS